MCGIQMHRENITAATPDESYGQTITIPLLDHLLMELTSRFNQHAKKATMGLCLVPSVMRKTHDWRHHVDSLVELFKEDLPSPLSVPSELHTWSIKFTNWDQSTVPSSPLQALIQCDKRYFLTSSRSWKLLLHCQWQHVRLNEVSRPCAAWKPFYAPQPERTVSMD